MTSILDNMTAMTPIQKARKARTQLLIEQPFFGYLATKLDIVETDRIPTSATDGVKIYISPAHWKKLDKEFAAFEIAHEVCHCVLRHMERRNGRENFLWNCAGDFAANLMLQEAIKNDQYPVYKISKDCLIDDKYKAMVAEQIYEMLKKDRDEHQKQSPQTECVIFDKPGNGDGSDKEEKDAAGATTGEKINWEVAVKEAIAYAKSRGNMPGGLEAMITELMKPKVNWRAILYRYMSRARRDDYSFNKPNKRYAHLGIVLPSLYNHVGSVIVAEDTSGSISDENLQQFAGEVYEIAKNLKLDVTWIQCDADIRQVFDLSKKPDLVTRAKHKGRGGTDFTPVFEYVEKKRLKPDVLIYLTDGEGSMDASIKRPPFDVLWVLTKGGAANRECMPWGHILEANL